MNYTEKYHLPQWEESDRVMRTDFNQMCANIESGIDGARAQAAQSDAALDQKINAVKDSADNAHQTAVTHKNYVSGTYKGNNSALKIETGFAPSAVIICRMFETNAQNNAFCATMVFIRSVTHAAIIFEDDGFTVRNHSCTYPVVNADYSHFVYLALR